MIIGLDFLKKKPNLFSLPINWQIFFLKRADISRPFKLVESVFFQKLYINLIGLF